MVAPDEWVIFQVETSAPGTVTLSEEGRPPLVPSWSVEEGGAYFLGGDPPLAYRPDPGEPLGRSRYIVEVCVQGEPSCQTAALILEWAQP